MSRLRLFLRREEGTALITAVVLVGVMAMLGLAVHAAADTQSKQSGDERVRESAFGMTEAALNAQIFQLARRFPNADYPWPAACSPASPPSDAEKCAGQNNFDGYTGGDYDVQCNGTAVTRWTTTVRDNEVLNPGTPQAAPNPFYSTAVINAKPTYDANNDGVLWVRADGRAGCRTRSIVTQVRAGERAITFPANVVTANAFETTNRGNKVILDTNGAGEYESEAAKVVLRCQGHTVVIGGCAKYEPNKGQISPETLEAPATTPNPLIGPEGMASIIALAHRNSTWYPANSCPGRITGEVVYIVSLAPGCRVLGGNSIEKPGLVVVGSGKFVIGGNDEFYGTVYMRNESVPPINGAVVEIGGTAAIIGAVAVDGPGTVSAGSSKANIVYDSRAASLVKGLGSATAVPNTWRELRPGE